jgi:hypothetical protein
MSVGIFGLGQPCGCCKKPDDAGVAQLGEPPRR